MDDMSSGIPAVTCQLFSDGTVKDYFYRYFFYCGSGAVVSGCVCFSIHFSVHPQVENKQ